MEYILDEIRRALAAQLWYAALALALTLPDTCANLEAGPGARTDGVRARYRAWCRKYLPQEPVFYDTDDLFWELRNGVVHEASLRHKKFTRIRFTVPPGGGVQNVVIVEGELRTLVLHLPTFCETMIAATRKWYEANKASPNVRRGIEGLLQPRPEGLRAIGGVVTIG